jgi:hypothetical protein
MQEIEDGGDEWGILCCAGGGGGGSSRVSSVAGLKLCLYAGSLEWVERKGFGAI